ncbi:MAG TPA: hypothetical protein VJ183_08890 [Chloroflexia bacterium]|nr:hypothetical protein [Chloroflexia bacterium]
MRANNRKRWGVWAAGLVPATLLVTVILVLWTGRPATPIESMNVEANRPSSTSGTNDFVMIDPQGDMELARKVVRDVVDTGTPQVMLSRKVIGGELPCLGFGWANALERRATDTFGLVVVQGDLRRIFPGDRYLPSTLAAYLYEIPHNVITAKGGSDWPSLRAVFGGTNWPQDSSMYLSPDGQPSVFELGFHFRERGSSEVMGQVVDVTQEAGGWKVKVVRVYAAADHVTIGYTVTGPRVRFKIDPPVLNVGGKSLRGTYWGLEYETMGPNVATATFWGVPESTQAQEMAMHFEVSAIHVRPPKYPCELPELRPEDYPTPTRIPDEIDFSSPRHTPQPDLESVGPFAFDLTVNVMPRPTEVSIPTPIPTITIEMPYIPIPQATGQP